MERQPEDDRYMHTSCDRVHFKSSWFVAAGLAEGRRDQRVSKRRKQAPLTLKKSTLVFKLCFEMASTSFTNHDATYDRVAPVCVAQVAGLNSGNVASALC